MIVIVGRETPFLNLIFQFFLGTYPFQLSDKILAIIQKGRFYRGVCYVKTSNNCLKMYLDIKYKLHRSVNTRR